MKFRRKKTEILEGDLTPMVDMTFQLIAFFMLIINFSEVEKSEEINLPLSELAKPPEEAPPPPELAELHFGDAYMLARRE